MKHSKTEAVFVFACDMPYLESSAILRQIAAFQNTSCEVMVPRHTDGIEPLHAIYSRSNLPYLEECLQTGRYSVRSFYGRTKARYFDIEDTSCFLNINTFNDLKQII